jgi:hypothetical protein
VVHIKKGHVPIGKMVVVKITQAGPYDLAGEIEGSS